MPNSTEMRRFTNSFEKCFPFHQEKITMFHSRDGVGAAEEEGDPPILSRGGQQSIYPGNTQRSRFSPRSPRESLSAFDTPKEMHPCLPKLLSIGLGDPPFQGSMIEGLDLGLNH